MDEGKRSPCVPLPISALISKRGRGVAAGNTTARDNNELMCADAFADKASKRPRYVMARRLHALYVDIICWRSMGGAPHSDGALDHETRPPAAAQSNHTPGMGQSSGGQICATTHNQRQSTAQELRVVVDERVGGLANGQTWPVAQHSVPRMTAVSSATSGMQSQYLRIPNHGVHMLFTGQHNALPTVPQRGAYTLVPTRQTVPTQQKVPTQQVTTIPGAFSWNTQYVLPPCQGAPSVPVRYWKSRTIGQAGHWTL